MTYSLFSMIGVICGGYLIGSSFTRYCYNNNDATTPVFLVLGIVCVVVNLVMGG